MCWCDPNCRTPCCGSDACHRAMQAVGKVVCPFCAVKEYANRTHYGNSEEERIRFGEDLLKVVENPEGVPLGAPGSLMRQAQDLGLRLKKLGWQHKESAHDKGRKSWFLDSAMELVQELAPRILTPNRLGISIGGSVLLDGYSNKDLDLIVFPYSTKDMMPIGEVRGLFMGEGWRLDWPWEWIKNHRDKKGTGGDTKHVDGYRVPRKDGWSRVDVFYLK